jgi:protease IV
VIKRESIFGSIIIFLFVLSLFFSGDNTSQDSTRFKKSSTLFSKKGIAVVDIYGPISFPQYSTNLIPAGANLTLSQLTQIRQDDNVKGLILRINSPGGTVGASQEIYHAIKKIKDEKNIPIVAQIGDVGASGAYYAALGADTIFSNPGSLVGSIGVIIGNVSIDEFAQKYGLDYNVYKSGAYKDILSMWRESSKQEKELLQNLVDNVFEQFQADFIDSRKISKKDAEKVSQGQIYTGLQALELNLIDKIGGYEDSLVYIGELTGLGANPTIINKYNNPWMDVVNMLNNSFNARFNLNQPNVQLR